MSPEEMHHMKFSYDTLGEECLNRKYITSLESQTYLPLK